MNFTPELLNRWRIVPRLMVFWYAVLVWHVSDWFMELPTPTAEHTAFATIIVGLSTAIFALYVNSSPIKRMEQ